MAKMEPEIAKAFHDIRNTYQGLIFHFDPGMDFKLDPIKAGEQLQKDLALMHEAEQAIRER